MLPFATHYRQICHAEVSGTENLIQILQELLEKVVSVVATSVPVKHISDNSCFIMGPKFPTVLGWVRNCLYSQLVFLNSKYNSHL